METREQLLHRLGELRDAIEDARDAQDTATLLELTDEREQIRARLTQLQPPTREEVMMELEGLRARLGAFDPPPAMKGVLSVSGLAHGPVITEQSITLARRAQERLREDAGIDEVHQRVAHLEQLLRVLEDDRAG